MNRLLIIFLVIITVFTGCAANPPSDMSDSASGSESLFAQLDAAQGAMGENTNLQGVDVNTLPLSNAYATEKDQLSFTNADGKAAYTIVYPEKTIEIIHDAAEALRVALNNATGKKFKKHSDATPGDANTYEILIGDTNRSQSKHTLKEKEYSIKVDGNKIVITGGSYYSTAVAVSKFKELFSKSKPYIAKDLSIKSALNQVYRVAVSNSGDKSIDIYELTPFNTTPTLVKTFKNVGATGLNFRHTQTNGEVVVCASGTEVTVLSYSTGKKIWSKTGIASSAHGAEILPNGVVAVASSTPNTLSFFDMNGTASKTLELEDAHAVLWDPKYEVVWAAGYTEIRAYKVKLSNGTLTVTEDTSKRSPFNNTGAHDLAPVYYDKDKMWVSTFGKIYIYDKTTKKFSETIDGSNGIVCGRRVKGLGNFPDGSMITTYPDEKATSLYTWTTEKINFYFNLDGTLYPFFYETPGVHHYKCRVINTSYQ